MEAQVRQPPPVSPRLHRGGEGQRHVGAISYAIKATEAFAFEGLTDKEIRQFSKVLRRINRNFGDQDDDDEGNGE